MYTGLLHSHNGLRWLVLIGFLFAIGFAVSGWIKKRRFEKRDNIAGLLLVLFMDLQFIVGVALYAFVSPITKAAFTNFGNAMKNADLRFYAVEHILLMVIALVLVHVGRVKSKRNTIGWKGHKSATIYYSISILLILVAIPWDRALF